MCLYFIFKKVRKRTPVLVEFLKAGEVIYNSFGVVKNLVCISNIGEITSGTYEPGLAYME